MLYTKTGDAGETSLANGQRLPKNDPLIEALGDVDELNAVIGLLHSEYEWTAQEYASFLLIQNNLFEIGATLAGGKPCALNLDDVQHLEHDIDHFSAQTPPLKQFILPMGNTLIAHCHIARTVCRRAERHLLNIQPDPYMLMFLNRLSDWLFALSRVLSVRQTCPETPWIPRP
jgi:cob(I)alamin adenosyltransferase